MPANFANGREWGFHGGFQFFSVSVFQLLLLAVHVGVGAYDWLRADHPGFGFGFFFDDHR